MTKREFVYPPKDIIAKSRATTTSFTNPIIRLVFWERYKKAFSYLVSLQRTFDVVLEIGTSYGFCLPSLGSISRRVIGTDIKKTFDFCYPLTLKSIQKEMPNLELKIADVTRLSESVETESCDVILAFSVLEHVPDYEKGLEEVKKCLKKGGILVCELPSENMLYKATVRLMPRYGEAHEGYSYGVLEKAILKRFRRSAFFRVPYGLPYFYLGVYEKAD